MPYVSQDQDRHADLAIHREAVRKFVQIELVPKVPQWRLQHQPDRADWARVGSCGLLLCDVPGEYGGLDGTFEHTAIVLEELAYEGVHLGIREQSIVAHYLLRYGDDAQRRAWLPRLAAGEVVAAIAMTEPGAGSDLASIRTSAVRVGDEYVLNGSKTFITNGSVATLFCVAVRTGAAGSGPRGISLFVLDRDSCPGLRVGRVLEKLGMNEQDTCEIFLEDVRVPASCLLGGKEGQGYFQMMEQLPYERLQISVHAIAMAERALDLTARYVKDRKAFGKPLIELQGTRFSLAECKAKVDVGRTFVNHCINLQLAGRLNAVTAAVAKYWTTECQFEVIDTCVQLHGGYGYMTEYPIARMWADCRMQRIGGGANEVMKEIIGWSL